MPRYHFDLPADPDETGVELRDATASRAYALRYAGEMMRDLDAGSRGQQYWRMDVRVGDATQFSVVIELLPVASAAAAVRRAG